MRLTANLINMFRPEIAMLQSPHPFQVKHQEEKNEKETTLFWAGTLKSGLKVNKDVLFGCMETGFN